MTAAFVLPGFASAATTQVTEISNATANEQHFMKAFDAPSTAIADFDGDGKLELVGVNDNQYVYVMSSQTSRILAEFRPDYPANWGVRPINSPNVGDVDNDGRLDIIVVTSAATVCDFEFTGGSSTTSMSFTKRWCTRMDAFDGFGAAADGGAALADVTGDGKLEIFAQTEDKGLYAFNHDGSVRWKKDRFGGNADPLVTDMNRDGKKEAIFVSDGGTITAIDGATGTTRWTFWAGAYVKPASVPVSGNAADLDGDGKEEFVFIARHATHCCTVTEYKKNHFMMFVLDHNGALKWKVQPDWGNPMSYTHPILHDINGDGKKEILAMDWNTIGHKPGNWEKLGPANIFAYKHDGTLLWRTVMDNSWSNDDLGLADVDGDGQLEVLAIGYGPQGDGVWYLNAKTGAKEQQVGVGPWTALRGPVVGDLDRDGKTDWAIPLHSSTKGGAYKVFETTSPCNVAYGGFVVVNPCTGGPKKGTGTGTGGGSPPPPSGTFDATFTPKPGNEWWIETKVDANQALSGVDVRVNGGAWEPLSLKSWGNWAASYHAPSGSVVEFRAKSTGGATDISGAYNWPSATPTTIGSGGGGSSAFTATFTPKGGNEWWIQVGVDASKSLTGVDVRIDGGAWKPLQLKSWGDWAESYHAPSGSIVEFRAKAGAESVVSGKYNWPSGSSAGGGGSTGFDATFSNIRGNVWWVETDVSANRAIAGVDARVNGGAWQPLTKQSYGSWADGMSAPSGSTVEFRARATDGATDLSGGVRWPPS